MNSARPRRSPSPTSGSASWAPFPTGRRSRFRNAFASAARPGSCPTRCCCSSIRPCTRAAGAPARRSCPSARSTTARGASTWSTPTAAGASPTTAPGSSSAIRSCAVEDVHGYLRSMEAAIIAALARGRHRGRLAPPEGIDYTGVWVQERKIASIGVHVLAASPRTASPINVDNDLRPFSLGGRLRPARRADDLDRAGARPRPLHGARVRAPAGGVRLRRRARPPPAAGLPAAWGSTRRRPAGSRPDGPRWRKRHPSLWRGGPSVSATRSRANPGGMDVLSVLGPDVRPLRERKPPWFKVPAAGRRALPRAERADPLGEPPHRLPGGRLPERRRVLGAGHRHVHDPRRHVHAPMRVLQRQDRQADLERSARAGARGALDRADGPAPRGHHLGRPRRPPDKGACAFVGVIRQVRRQAPGCQVEVLTPDFQGQEMPLAKVIAERPDVFNHNVEVVPRLYPLARRGSEFARSCRVLRLAYELGRGRGASPSLG